MVMEYLVGRDLQNYLEAGEQHGGKFKPEYAGPKINPVCSR
jgi:hypothetical protein